MGHGESFVSFNMKGPLRHTVSYFIAHDWPWKPLPVHRKYMWTSLIPTWTYWGVWVNCRCCVQFSVLETSAKWKKKNHPWTVCLTKKHTWGDISYLQYPIWLCEPRAFPHLPWQCLIGSQVLLLLLVPVVYKLQKFLPVPISASHSQFMLYLFVH